MYLPKWESMISYNIKSSYLYVNFVIPTGCMILPNLLVCRHADLFLQTETCRLFPPTEFSPNLNASWWMSPTNWIQMNRRNYAGPSCQYLEWSAGSLVSQDNLLNIMGSSCPNQVALQADEGYHHQFCVMPSYYDSFGITVDASPKSGHKNTFLINYTYSRQEEWKVSVGQSFGRGGLAHVSFT